MNGLGDFIRDRVSSRGGNSERGLGLPSHLEGALARTLPPDLAARLALSVERLMQSSEFADSVNQSVAQPGPEETEDEFVERAKRALRVILRNQLDQ